MKSDLNMSSSWMSRSLFSWMYFRSLKEVPLACSSFRQNSDIRTSPLEGQLSQSNVCYSMSLRLAEIIIFLWTGQRMSLFIINNHALSASLSYSTPAQMPAWVRSQTLVAQIPIKHSTQMPIDRKLPSSPITSNCCPINKQNSPTTCSLSRPSSNASSRRACHRFIEDSRVVATQGRLYARGWQKWPPVMGRCGGRIRLRKRQAIPKNRQWPSINSTPQAIKSPVLHPNGFISPQITILQSLMFRWSYLPARPKKLCNVLFYKGQYTPPCHGLTISELHGKRGDFEWLERVHDYVQWMFPNYYQSNFSSACYPLSKEEAAKFRTDPALGRNVIISFLIFLEFMGARVTLKKKDVEIEATDQDRFMRVVKSRHNQLRFLRIMACLSITGFRQLSCQFSRFIISFGQKAKCSVSAHNLHLLELYLTKGAQTCKCNQKQLEETNRFKIDAGFVQQFYSSKA